METKERATTTGKRKPLRNVTNHRQREDVKTPATSVTLNSRKNEDQEDDSTRRQLLCLRSCLSSLTQQVDKLIAKAIESKPRSKQGRKQIDSFSNFLSEMIASLEPWASKLEEIEKFPPTRSDELLVPEQPACDAITKVSTSQQCHDLSVDFLVSPSPLVSWKGNKYDQGKQIFLLTAQPSSKTLSDKTKASKLADGDEFVVVPPLISISEDADKDLLQRAQISQSPIQPLEEFPELTTTSKHENLLRGTQISQSPLHPLHAGATPFKSTVKNGLNSTRLFSEIDYSLFLLTPRLKASPPCKSRTLFDKVRKCTPFPVGVSSGVSNSSSESSEKLYLKYPELLGIRQAYIPPTERKKAESSPDLSYSPLKTTFLLENKPSSPVKEAGVSQAVVESTPVCQAPAAESVMRTGRRAGESTLKKELWTKFEAASYRGFRVNTSAIQRTCKKGFLDMLDEVSSNDES